MPKLTKRFAMLSLVVMIGLVTLGRGLFEWQQKRELDAMCVSYLKMLEQGEELTAESAVAIAEGLDQIVKTSSLRRVRAALALVEPSQRIQLLESAAMEEGFANWSCKSAAP